MRPELKNKFIDFANIVKAFVGSNYLQMPFAFYQAGLGPGLVLIVLIAALTFYCCLLIVENKKLIVREAYDEIEKAAHDGLLTSEEMEMFESGQLVDAWEKSLSLGHMAKYSFGRPGQYFVTIALFLTQCGFCINYFVFIGNSLEQFFAVPGNTPASSNASFFSTPTTLPTTIAATTTLPEEPLPVNLIYLVLTPTPIFLLFALIKSLRGVGVYSALANASIAGGYITVIVYMFYVFSVNATFRWYQTISTAVSFGMFVSSFEGIGTIIPIESSMNENRKNFPLYLTVAITILTALFSLMGLIGYLLYGNDTQQLIIKNIPAGSLLSILLNAGLIVGILCTYPLQMYPVTEIFEFILFRERVQKRDPPINLRTRGDPNDYNVSQSANTWDRAQHIVEFKDDVNLMEDEAEAQGGTPSNKKNRRTKTVTDSRRSRSVARNSHVSNRLKSRSMSHPAERFGGLLDPSLLVGRDHMEAREGEIIGWSRWREQQPAGLPRRHSPPTEPWVTSRPPPTAADLALPRISENAAANEQEETGSGGGEQTGAHINYGAIDDNEENNARLHTLSKSMSMVMSTDTLTRMEDLANGGATGEAARRNARKTIRDSITTNDAIAASGVSLSKQQERMFRVAFQSEIRAPKWKRNAARLFLVAAQLLVAVVVRDYFSYFNSLVGALGSTFLAFIFPAGLHYALTRHTASRLSLCKDVAITVLGVAAGLLSVTVTLISMVSSDLIKAE